MALEKVEWKDLEPEFLSEWGWPEGKWDPEHLAVLGPTGSGKSLFSLRVVQQRAALRGSHVVILASKPDDSTLRALRWPIIEKWPPNYGQNTVIFWPCRREKPEQRLVSQRAAFKSALDSMWVPNANITVYFDEIVYLELDLKLKVTVNTWWRESRALGITMVATTQRPRLASRYMYSEPAWVAAFKPQDEDEAIRMAEISGSKKEYKPILMGLKRYEFLLIRRKTNEAFISRIRK